jgi:hypothetical protein
MNDSDLLERLKARVGKPAATLVAAEDDSQRHFITELTLSAVALYLLSKYVDGFVEGIGVKELGKEHAQLAQLTLESATEYVTSKAVQLRQALGGISKWLRPHRERSDAKAKAEEMVSQTLRERGVPDFEARDIAEGMSDELFAE